jgi:hypothetical protein
MFATGTFFPGKGWKICLQTYFKPVKNIFTNRPEYSGRIIQTFLISDNNIWCTFSFFLFFPKMQGMAVTRLPPPVPVGALVCL